MKKILLLSTIVLLFLVSCPSRTSKKETTQFFKSLEPGEQYTIKFKNKSNIWYMYTNIQDEGNSIPAPSTTSFFREKVNRISDNINGADKQILQESISAIISYPRAKDPEEEPTTNLDDPQDSNDEDEDPIAPRHKTFYDFYDKDGNALDVPQIIEADKVVDTGFINTANGERRLLIYVESDLSDYQFLPTQEDYELIADCFLKAGSNNDIYDYLTSIFGSDDGYLTYDYLKNLGQVNNGVIPFDGTITLLYCDIAKQGVDSVGKQNQGYIAAAYRLDNNIVWGDDEEQNKESMILLHAYGSGGKKVGVGLMSLVHEFTRLLHYQYFNINKFLAEGPDSSINWAELIADVPESLTETWPCGENERLGCSDAENFFGVLAEELLSKFICEKTKTKYPDVDLRDSYYIFTSGNMKGYVDPKNDNFYITNIPKIKNQTKGTSFMKSLGKKSIFDKDKDSGLLESVAHYILANYGDKFKDCFDEYKKAKTGNTGNVKALLNSLGISNSAFYDFIEAWGLSTLLSNVKEMPKPYRSYCEGFFNSDIHNLQIPSINYHIYSYSGQEGEIGFKANNMANNIVVPPCAFNFRRISTNEDGEYSNIAPNFDKSKMRITVVAVPK